MAEVHAELGRVFFRNRDGTSRQRVIEHYVRPGTPLVFHLDGHYLDGEPCVGVWVKVKPWLRSPRMVKIGDVDPLNGSHFYQYIDEGGQIIGRVEKVSGKPGEGHRVSYVALDS